MPGPTDGRQTWRPLRAAKRLIVAAPAMLQPRIKACEHSDRLSRADDVAADHSAAEAAGAGVGL